jgi:hypothetical protein
MSGCCCEEERRGSRRRGERQHPSERGLKGNTLPPAPAHLRIVPQLEFMPVLHGGDRECHPGAVDGKRAAVKGKLRISSSALPTPYMHAHGGYTIPYEAHPMKLPLPVSKYIRPSSCVVLHGEGGAERGPAFMDPRNATSSANASSRSTRELLIAFPTFTPFSSRNCSSLELR